MRKILLLGTALMVALVPLSAASAGDVDARAIEKIVMDLENVIGRIEGIDFEALTVRSHGGNLSSVAIPLPEAARERLRASARSSASDFKALAAGLQLTEPGNFSTLITAVQCIPNRDYHFWFTVANLRNTDQTKRTTFQLKGPGDKFKIVEHLIYDAGSLVLFFVIAPSGDAGFHIVQAKVANGGKAKSTVICFEN